MLVASSTSTPPSRVVVSVCQSLRFVVGERQLAAANDELPEKPAPCSPWVRWRIPDERERLLGCYSPLSPSLPAQDCFLSLPFLYHRHRLRAMLSMR